jgi:hypothetical protein
VPSSSPIRLLQAMPDEPVWSHYSRFVVFAGREELRSAALTLFRKGRGGGKRQFMLRLLDVLAKATGESLRDYWTNHATAVLLLPATEAFALSQMRAWDQFHSRLALWESPVRACPTCAKEDRASSGFAWFRRRHQLPLLAWCTKHDVRLESVAVARGRLTGLPESKLPVVRVIGRGVAAAPPRYVAIMEVALELLLQLTGEPRRLETLTRHLAETFKGKHWTILIQSGDREDSIATGWQGYLRYSTENVIDPFLEDRLFRYSRFFGGGTSIFAAAIFLATSFEDAQEVARTLMQWPKLSDHQRQLLRAKATFLASSTDHETSLPHQ